MPKSRNKRKNKEKNIRIKEQKRNIANKKVREYRDEYGPSPLEMFFKL